MQLFVKCFAENLLDRSVDETWPTDTNLNRVSVIHFQDDSKHEEEDEETAADKRVSVEIYTGCLWFLDNCLREIVYMR